MRVLMVCLGNICRSPMAEVILRDKAQTHGLDWVIESSGTNRYHKGGPADSRAVAACRTRKLDLSQHIARRFQTKDFERYDLIYVMADEVRDEMEAFVTHPDQWKKVRNLLEEIPGQKDRDVPDPWYGSDEGFDDCFDLIERACDAVIAKYGKRE